MALPCPPKDAVAVVFVSQRRAGDDAGYGSAAAKMEQMAAQQPGYLGFVAARGTDGVGIAVSYWQDEDAAKAWRDHPDHALIRENGRASWYDAYALSVSQVTRSYGWRRSDA